MMTVDKPSRPRTQYGEYAGFVTRLIAMIIDLLLLSVFVTLVAVLGNFLTQVLPLDRGAKLVIAISSIVVDVGVIIGYFVVLLTFAGQTIGKRVMGVRVVSADGGRIKPGQAGRRLLGSILSLPLFWGYLIALGDDKRRAFHDRLAGTLVIYSWPEPTGAIKTPLLDQAQRGLRRKPK